MRKLIVLALALVTALAAFAPAARLAFADDDAPLFVNLTTDEPHRATMALGFAKKQLERGHPVTVFLNDRGVMLAAKANAEKFLGHQRAIAEMKASGARIVICPMCMEHYGLSADGLVDGIETGNPDLTGSLLFEDDTKTLNW